MKRRVLVMNGQRIVQAEKDGAWSNEKVDKAGTLKPGIYDLFAAHAAEKAQQHVGAIIHADDSGVYQQTGKAIVMHSLENFDIVPDIGSSKSIRYDEHGKAVVSAEGAKSSRGKPK